MISTSNRASSPMFNIERFDHVGLRVADLGTAQQFYEKLGFRADPGEESPDGKARGLVNDGGVRIHLIYNGVRDEAGNVLMDVPVKRPGFTHAAFVVDDLDELVGWLNDRGITITEGPSVFGHGRRKVCFIRDPDRNVLEFNQIL